jgi:hypothetical protein
MIDYPQLHSLLLGLEGQVTASPASGFSAATCVRTTLSPVQGFALHIGTKGLELELPVIVAIGANYTQGKTRCPRDHFNGQPAVEDNLQDCRANLDRAFKSPYTPPKAPWSSWVRYGKASPGRFRPPDEYHLVMTNFCLWNTKAFWQKISSVDRETLLDNNPLFAGGKTAAPAWEHIKKLADALKPDPILWVAHGMWSEVFTLFGALGRVVPMPNWIMTPNLARFYGHYGRCYPRLKI